MADSSIDTFFFDNYITRIKHDGKAKEVIWDENEEDFIEVDKGKTIN